MPLYRKNLKWWERILLPTILLLAVSVYIVIYEAALEVGGFLGYLIIAILLYVVITVAKKMFPK
jgi:hypothetical protein